VIASVFGAQLAEESDHPSTHAPATAPNPRTIFARIICTPR
jgi:hypothetical protein